MRTLEDLVAAFPDLPPVEGFPIKDKVSVIMHTYHRPEHVKRQITRFTKSSVFHRLYIVFNDFAGETYDSAALDAGIRKSIDDSKGTIEPLFPARNSQLNRLAPPASLQTRWVFLVDDDIDVQNVDLERSFTQVTFYPLQAIGFGPMAVTAKGGAFQYGLPSSGPHSTYNTLKVGMGTFVSAHMLTLFAQGGGAAAAARAIAWQQPECDELVFNMVLSHITGLAPIFAMSSSSTTTAVEETMNPPAGTGAAAWDLAGARASCLASLTAADGPFGGVMPLVDSDMMFSPFTFNKPALVALMLNQGATAKDMEHWT